MLQQGGWGNITGRRFVRCAMQSAYCLPMDYRDAPAMAV
jgi:hypothetical protein